jgi:hypothetical protein
LPNRKPAMSGISALPWITGRSALPLIASVGLPFSTSFRQPRTSSCPSGADRPKPTEIEDMARALGLPPAILDQLRGSIHRVVGL